MMEDAYREAKNFKLALKEAQDNHQPGGTFHVDIIEITNLMGADNTGYADPVVIMKFSSMGNQQECETDCVRQTLNPKFKKNKWKFNVVNETDILRIEVYDKDFIPFPKKELIAVCEVFVGPGTQAGEAGVQQLHLHAPARRGDGLNGFLEDAVPHGQIKIDFQYVFSKSANMWSAPEDPKEEEFELTRFKESIERFSGHMGNMTAPLNYFNETCMWTRPFETAFWLLLLYSFVFIFPSMISAAVPGLLTFWMLRNYWKMTTWGFNGPPQPVSTSTMSNWEWMRYCQNALTHYSDMLDDVSEIVTWKRKDTARNVTKALAAWTLSAAFLPFFPPERIWFFLFILMTFTVYPIYVTSPRVLFSLQAKAVALFEHITDPETIDQWLPYVPEKLRQYIPKSEAQIISEEVEKQLPPIPKEDMSYEQWKKYVEIREKHRNILELKRHGFLDANGKVTKVEATGRLDVRIISATGIGADRMGSCDPYIELVCNQQTHETAVRNKTLNPIWNQDFVFLEVGHMSGVLSLEVFDKNVVQANKSLGSCHVQLKEVIRDRSRTLEIPIVSNGSTEEMGKIALKIKGEGASWPTEREYQLLEKLQAQLDKAKEEALSQPADSRVGSLAVALCYGAGLKICDRTTSDPYCYVCLVGHYTDKKPPRSKTIKNTLKPVWNENFNFTRVSSTMRLELRVYDEDKMGADDFMGSGSVSLDDIFEGETEEKTIRLQEGGKPAGTIVVKLKATGFGRILPSVDEVNFMSPTKGLSQSPPPRSTSVQSMGHAPVSPKKIQRGPSHSVSSSLASPSQRPPIASGKKASLSITVMEARNLDSHNAEVFVRILLLPRIGHTGGPTPPGMKFRTKPVVYGTSSPVWGIGFTFVDLPETTPTDHQLQIEVWDNKLNIIIASGRCDLNLLMEQQKIDSWISVFKDSKEAGQVRLALVPKGMKVKGS
eukprot:TRINITY_DN6315_c0_g1_i2.p1 TRINITY_DN6315_c0_g1~~TRINITY_DN6315_c0_g1_i2.p1  ORF type:complete len:942 (+),score=125.78 TRINITY_DN6315_c0_g1_i2:183-3008(+)